MPERPKPEPVQARQPAEEGPGPLARRLQALAKNVVDFLVGSHLATGGLFVLAFTAVLSAQECGISYPDFRVGEIARDDIPAPFDVTIVATKATEERRREERQKVLPVYDYDPTVLSQGSELIHGFFQTGRDFLTGQGEEGEKGAAPEDADPEDLPTLLPIPIEKPALDYLVAREFSAELEASFRETYEAVMREKVADNRLPLRDSQAIRILKPGGGEIRFDRLETILALDVARDRIAEAIREAVPDLDRRQATAMVGFLQSMVNPNYRYDSAETELRRDEAARLVTPLVSEIPRGKMIIREGEQFTEEQIDALRQIEKARGAEVDFGSWFGYLILGVLLVFFLRRYVGYLRRDPREAENLFGMNMVIALGMMLLCFALILLGEVLAEMNAGRVPFNRLEPYLYAIPVAAGAMFMALLSRPRIAMVFSVFLAVTFGLLAGWDMQLATYALISSFAGVYGITQYKQRTAILKAGMVVGMVNAVTILALSSMEGTLPWTSVLLFDLACGFVGGILVSITVSAALPVLEWMFNVLTDIRLLELSNLNSTLLRKLAVQAPGTYNHSVIVGTLAEAAAQAIGVNSLLCRVAAYYHDIGKMNKPEYFIENQQDATGRHAKLSPTMSSLIIASHVKDGIKLAKEYNLPKAIVDIIPQHHGTRLITYFFKKAKKHEDPKIQEVSESNFRYPGPRPQSKEAAIFMMADSVEGAARTVEDPTPGKFKDVIRKIVNAVIMDDQLTETELTFSDLERIQESFIKTLTSIYHHRIEYPGFKFEDRPGRDRIPLPG